MANERDPAAQFLGVADWMKNWTGLGIAGVVCMLFSWLIMWELPRAQNRFYEWTSANQVDNRLQIDSILNHHECAIEKLVAVMKNKENEP